jgi:hypothetical protein
MLNIFMLFIGLSLIVLFGYRLSHIFLPEAEKLEQISLGFFLGIGIFTFIWFLLNWIGIPYNLMSGLIILTTLNVILFLFDKYLSKPKNKNVFLDLTYFSKLNIFEKFLLGVIVFLCVSALVQCVYWPIRYWDSLVLYDFRAKVFVETGFMQAAIARGYFFGYPLLTSLAHTWVYLLGGKNPTFLYALMYIFLLTNFFINIKKLKIARTLTIFFTGLVAISPRLFDHTQWAYTNLPYSIYLVLGSIYLYFGIKKKNLGAFIISALLIGLSTWTRSTEPFWLSFIVVAALYSVFIKKWFWPVFYIAIVGSLMLPWRLFESIHNEGTLNVVSQVASTSQSVTKSLQISILKPAFDFVMANVVYMYLPFFILLAVIFLVKLFTKSKEWLYITLIVFNLILVFAGTMMFVKYTTYWQDIPDSLARMMMYIPVMIIFLAAEAWSELTGYNIKKL